MQVPTWKGESGRERWGPEEAGWYRARQEGSEENHAGPLVPLPLSSPAGHFPHSAGPEEEGKDLVLFSKLNSALSNHDKRERSTWRNHSTPCRPLSCTPWVPRSVPQPSHPGCIHSPQVLAQSRQEFAADQNSYCQKDVFTFRENIILFIDQKLLGVRRLHVVEGGP